MSTTIEDAIDELYARFSVFHKGKLDRTMTLTMVFTFLDLILKENLEPERHQFWKDVELILQNYN